MGKNAASPSPVLTPLTQTPGIADYSTKLWDDRPSYLKNHVIRNACLFLFIITAFEETASFAINQSLKNFFQKLGWSNKGSNSMKLTYDAIAQFSCIVAGYISDEKIGKFKTLLGAASIDSVGFAMLVIASLPSVLKHQQLAKVIFNVGLFLGVALTQICLRSVSISYGGDQFSPTTPLEEKRVFFSIHYWVANIGAFIGYAVFPSVSLHGLGAIPAEYGYTTNFAIGLASLVLFVFFLWISRSRYVNVPPTKGSISQVLTIVAHRAKTNWRARFVAFGFLLYLSAFLMNVIASFYSDHGELGRNISKAAGGVIVVATAIWVYFGRNNAFLEGVKESYGGKFDDELVDGVKKVIRILPFNAFNVFWWVCQNQRGNNQSIIQQTDVRLGSGPHASQIPGPTVQMFNPIGVLLFVPLTERVIYPLYERWAGKPASRYGKVLTGYCIAVIAMIWTGCFEIIRRSRPVLTYEENGVTKFITNNDGKQVMNDIPWFAGLPHYFLVALAGVFIVIPSYDICYSEVPASMRSTSIALGFFVNSMGSTLLSAIVLLFGKYIPANLNNGHMEYLHFTLAGVMCVNIFFFTLVMNQMQLGMIPKLDKNAKGETPLIINDSQAKENTELVNDKTQ